MCKYGILHETLRSVTVPQCFVSWSFVDFIQYWVFDISVPRNLGFPTCYCSVTRRLVSVALFGYVHVPRGMKITLPDMYICIWQVCHELNFNSAPEFVVFSRVLVAPLVFYDFIFVLQKQTSSSLLRIYLTRHDPLWFQTEPQSPRLHRHYEQLSSKTLEVLLTVYLLSITGITKGLSARYCSIINSLPPR